MSEHKTEKNKNIEKLMAHDEEATRVNANIVGHQDRKSYIEAKAYKYRIYANIIMTVGVIVGVILIIAGAAVIGVDETGEKPWLPVGFLVMLIIGIIIIVASVVIGKLLYNVAKNKIATNVYEGKY
jgi:uncharacterized membrane protein